MDNMQDLLNYVLPYAEQNATPVEDITLDVFCILKEMPVYSRVIIH